MITFVASQFNKYYNKYDITADANRSGLMQTVRRGICFVATKHTTFSFVVARIEAQLIVCLWRFFLFFYTFDVYKSQTNTFCIEAWGADCSVWFRYFTDLFFVRFCLIALQFHTDFSIGRHVSRCALNCVVAMCCIVWGEFSNESVE